MKRWELLTEAEWARLVDEAAALCDRLVDMTSQHIANWGKWNRVTDQAFSRLQRRAATLEALREVTP